MGQTDSKKKIQEQFQIFKIQQDGNALLKSKKDSKQYLMRIITCATKIDLDRLKAILQSRAQQKNHHILSLVQIKQKQQDFICSIHYKIYLVLEYSFKNLAQEIKQRSVSAQKKYFQESDIWSILYSCCTALNSLYSNGATHQSLTAQQIFINKDGFVKIAQPLLFGLQKNHLQAMRTKDQNIIKVHLSPQIIGCLDDHNFFFYDKQKSDIFVLGMIIIDIALLSNHFLFDVSKKKHLFQEIQILLREIKELYSNNLVIILSQMLHIESRLRPSLSQIIQKVQKCNNIGEDFTVQTESNMKSNEFSSERDHEKINFEKSGKYPQVLKQQLLFDSEKKKNNLIFRGFSGQTSLFNKEPQIVFNNQNFDAKVLVSTPNPNMQGLKNNFPVNYQQAKNSNINIIQQQVVRHQGQKYEDYQKSYVETINLATSQYKVDHIRSYSPVKPVLNSNDIKVQFQKKVKNEPIFTHEIPEVYNIIMSTKNTTKSQNKTQPDIIIQKNTLPAKQSQIKQIQISKMNKFQNFKGNRQVISIFEEQIDSPTFQTIELKKNISHTQSQKPSTGKQYKRQIDSIPNPFTSNFKNTIPNFSFNKPNPFVNSNFAYSLSAVSSYGANNSPVFSSSFIPSFPAPSKCESFTSRSQYAHLGLLQNNEIDGLKLEFVKQDVPDRGHYQGYKLNEQKNGHGTLYFKDGGHYEGEWKHDKMHGFGKLYYENGKIAYQGNWQNDEFNGQGRFYNSDPISFNEQFNYRDFSQLGNKWTYYEGQFKNDSKNGKGYIKLTNGEMYEGIFDHDMIEGNGIFYKRSGQIIIGFWIDNKLFLNQSYQFENKK